MENRFRYDMKKSPEEFLRLAVKIQSKADKSSLKTVLWSCNSKLSQSLPISLHQFISQSVESLKKYLESSEETLDPPENPPASGEDEDAPKKRLRRSTRHRRDPNVQNADCSNPTILSRKQVLLKNLQIYTHITHLCISHPQKAFSASDLLPSAQALHNNLVFYESDPVLQSEIASLCEEWWKECFPGRETLVAQSLPFLLSRSLSLGKKVDVHRVYVLREAFSLFDFVDESIEDLKLLLVRCVVSPLYLKTEEGRRFIAFLFGLNGQLVKEALAIIRSQIPFGRKSILEAYGDILFRAWKVAEASSRDEIENGFIQGLIEGAIHASSRSLAASARRVLGGFTSQRTTEGVEKLLFRLLEPVLFRSLQVANSNVRQNALLLLVDMFPLEDPDATKEVKDTLIDKQFFLMEKMLIDDCPNVRIVAVEGSCRILRLFWEVIPSPIITKLLEKIVDVISCDACSEVRVSVLNGVIYLLGNPQTHQVLKVLLPRLEHMMQDPNLSVRVVVADLLLALRDIRTFQFNKVVGLDALLSSLANDHFLVAQRLTRLLLPSYFPSKVPLKEACSRCIALIKRSDGGGARLCEFALSQGSSPKSLLELVKVLVSLVLSPNDDDRIEGFFVSAAKLCHCLSREPSCKTALNEFFSAEKLKCLLSAATTMPAHTSVLSIASIVSPVGAPGLLEHCIDLVTNCGGLSENTEMQAEVRAAHKLILSFGGFDKLVKTITDLLHKSASGNNHATPVSEGSKRVTCTKRKKVKLPLKLNVPNGRKPRNSGVPIVQGNLAVAAGAAWQIKDLLTSADTRKSLLSCPALGLSFSALKVISQRIIERCLHCESLDASPVMAYTALAMHMSLQVIDRADTNEPCDDNNTRSSPELTETDKSLNDLFDSTEKLFHANDPGKSNSSPPELQHEQKKKSAQCRRSKRREALADGSNPGEAGKGSESKSNLPEAKAISNIVTMATIVLKSTVDATGLRLVSNKQEIRCLEFASAYVDYINSALEKHPNRSVFKEDEMKEIFTYLRSSFTYAAKLLNLILANSNNSSNLPAVAASGLANRLLDLIVSTESNLGSRHAARLAAVAKPWLPDLILAVGWPHVLANKTEAEEDEDDDNEKGLSNLTGQNNCRFPSWVAVLGKVELSELSKDEEIEVADIGMFSVLKNFVEMAVVLLKKGDPMIMDGIGVVVLMGAATGLERGQYELVYGLVHFVCVKLVGLEGGKWEELKLVLGCLREIHCRIERELDDSRVSQDGKQKLERAKALLEEVCTHVV